ncbi:hypothetical protein ScPMuIL_005848 [Solemya velum]
MDETLRKVSNLGSEKFSPIKPTVIQYGTAGFRANSELLSHVMYRMGLLAALRSKKKKATVAVMITASHNPEEDNGVKLIEPMGEMLEITWESFATSIANAPDVELSICLESIINKEEIDFSLPADVVFARDTRSVDLHLSQAMQCGLEVMGSTFTDFGLLTTPQLHYIVRCMNTNGAYGEATEEGYYCKLAKAFASLRKSVLHVGNYDNKIQLDAANGVGACKMKEMIKHLECLLDIELHKDGSDGRLNYKCGADFVKVQQTSPEGVLLKPGVKYASFDGDADRIVFFYADEDHKFHLLDGDKIATLVANFLQQLITASGLSVNMGLVQTAYANGSSTVYITEELKIPAACVPTGVKHLHHQAQQFDVGVYFEANGHGTVLFSSKASEIIQNAVSHTGMTDEQKSAASKLLTVMDLINQTVGDAISDLLLVEIILCTFGWSMEDWDKCYIDLPNRQLKVKVKDRNDIQTADAERKVVKPSGLQEEIDQLVSKFNKGRSFVRPSGTEDVVRIYAEADCQVNADRLAHEVSVKVYEIAGGVGDKP